MLLKGCNRCGVLIPYGAPYCGICSPIVEKEREARRVEAKRLNDRKYNKTRDRGYVRFYNSKEWGILSRRYAQDKGYRCEVCRGIATQVHHRVPIQSDAGWKLRLDYNNLELLCISCHNDKHNRFKKKSMQTSTKQNKKEKTP